MKKILTIIVTYNGMKWLNRCLGSLRASSVPTDVFVVDNGSTDGTQSYVRENFPEVTLYCTGENLGFGKANNIGLSKALKDGYDYVYLMNQDAWIFPETLAVMVAAMDSSREYGIVSPIQLVASEDRMDPRFIRWCPEQARKQWQEHGTGEIHQTGFVMAAHWMISRDCLCKVGGFSPAFPHYGEDDNYIHRAQYHGFKCGILSSAGAVHDREMRPMTKDARMRLKCVASVVKISNPLNNFIFRCVAQPIELLAISLRYCSTSVFAYIFKLIGSYCSLKTLRHRSKSECAFLSGEID